MTKANFLVNTNGTVFDAKTNLIWQRDVTDHDEFDLEDAKKYAANLRLGGFSNWRVPTKTELESIVASAKFNPAIDIDAFPNTPSEWFWTVSPYPDNSDNAWVVHFGHGNGHYDDDYNILRVRCVRG